MNLFEGARRAAVAAALLGAVPATLVAVSMIVRGDIAGGFELIGGMIGCLLMYWCAVWLTGWIARGFLGIKRGQDYKVDPVQR